MRLLKGGTPIQPVHITAPKPNPIEQAYAQKQLGLNDGQTVQMPSAQRMLASQLVGGARDVMQSFNPVEWGKQAAEQTNEGVGNWKFGNKTDALKSFGGAALATGGLIGMPEGGMLEEGLVPKYRAMAENAIAKARAFTAANDAKLAQWGQANAIPMWHSSPVRDIDRFTLSKAGTGQGAAVYGHGLYQAESPLISGPGGAYDAEMTSRSLTRGDVPLENFWSRDDLGEVLGHLRDPQSDFSRNHLAEMFADRDNTGRTILRPTSGYLDDIDEIWRHRGGVYRTAIQASPEQFLNLDAPFSYQPPPVQEALQRLTVRRPRGFGVGSRNYGNLKNLLSDQFQDGTYGHEIYNTVDDLMQADELPGYGHHLKPAGARASDALARRGVVGNIYLDGASRYVPNDIGEAIQSIKEDMPFVTSQSEQHRLASLRTIESEAAKIDELVKRPLTRNTATFSPSRIKILEKLGLLGLVGGASQIPQLPNNQP